MATTNKEGLKKTKKDLKAFFSEEPWYYYIGFYIMVGLILMMYVFALTGWTEYGRHVHEAQNFWLIVGILFQAAGAYILYRANKSMAGVSWMHLAGFAFFLALGFCAFAGFKF